MSNPEQSNFDFENYVDYIKVPIPAEKEGVRCACGDILGEGTCSACINEKIKRGEIEKTQKMPSKFRGRKIKKVS